MIRTRTVLILGAGASMPYGFPSGSRLVEEVLAGLRTYKTRVANLLMGLGYQWHDIAEFHKELLGSDAYSVDFFLEPNPKFRKLGKTAIAIAIAAHEEPSRFDGSDARESGWYRYLLNLLTSGVPLESFGENQLSILTFNYDRSLEYYLENRLRAFYGCSAEESRDALRVLNLIHLHGSLGRLPGWGGSGLEREYDPTPDPDWANEAHNLVQVVAEVDKRASPYHFAKPLLARAEKVVFLGCGYHPQNMTHLGLSSEGVAGGAQLFGSAFGLEKGERARVLRSWAIDLGDSGAGALIYLRRDADLG